MASSEIRPTTRVARGVTYLFIQGLVNAVIGLIYFVVLARILSQEEMGVFALLFFILSIPQVFGLFSLPSAAVKFMSKYIAKGDYDNTRAVVKRVLQISTLMAVVSFLVLFIPADWLSIQLFSKPDYALHLRLVALSSAFNLLYNAVIGFLQGLQKMSDYAALGLIYTIIQNSVGIFLLSIGWGLSGVVMGWLLGISIAFIPGLVKIIRELGISGKPHEIKPLFKFSLPLYFSGVLVYFMSWADQLILVSYMSLIYGATVAQQELGIYYVAIRASAVPALFSTAIVVAVFPQLSALYTQQGSNSLKEAFHLSSRYAILIGFPLIIGIAVLAYPIIILFAGVNYSGAALPLIIISIGTLVATLGVTIGPIFMTLERTLLLSVLSVISVIVSVVLSFFALGVLGLGMVGTAWARSIANIIALGLNFYVLNRYVKLSIDREALWKASLASVLMTAAIIVADMFRGFISPSSYQFLVFRLHLLPVYVVIGAITYFFVLIVLRAIKRSDIDLFEEYLPKGFRGLASLLERIAKG